MIVGIKRCILVLILVEVEFYFNGGYDDIIYVYLFFFDKVLQVVQFLLRFEKFYVLVDNYVIFDLFVVYFFFEGKKWLVFLKVNCGYNRGKLICLGVKIVYINQC